MKLIGVTCISTIQHIAMDGISADKDGIIRSTSDAPPTHYTVKIQLFSVLLKNAVEKYESGEFEAGGYKWKLVLYPNGNKSKNVKDHISLCLAIADTSSLSRGWEVYAVVRLFLLDQNKDNYLMVQDALGMERRFHGLKLELGFDRYIPLTVFNDASNGYLVEDLCVFGAEVYVCKETIRGEGECLSMIKDAPTFRHVWKVESFSRLNEGCCNSKVFIAGDHKWKLQLYPKGRRQGTDTHLSLYLALADSTTLAPGSKIYAEFTLRILDQVQAKHVSGKAKYWFSTSQQEHGWSRFMSLIYLNLPSTGCLVKDVCLVEAEATVLGISRALEEVGSIRNFPV